MTHPAVMARLLRDRAARGLWIPVTGSSMAPHLIPPAEAWVVADAPTPRIGEIWAFVTDDGDLLVHRFLRPDRGTLVFAGDANRQADPPLRADRLVGRVAAVRSDGHTPGALRSRAAVVRWQFRRYRRGLRRRIVTVVRWLT